MMAASVGMCQRDNVGARERGDGRARARAGTSPQSKIQNPKSKIAFTLVELLVVITIITVLAAFLFPVFGSIKQRTKQKN